MAAQPVLPSLEHTVKEVLALAKASLVTGCLLLLFGEESDPKKLRAAVQVLVTACHGVEGRGWKGLRKGGPPRCPLCENPGRSLA